MFEDGYGGLAGANEVLEVDDGEAAHDGAWHEVDLRLGDGAEGPLGADDHAGHVEGLSLLVVRGGGPGVHEVFEVVAADAANHLGVAGLDFIAVGLGDVDDATVYLRLQGVAGEFALQLGGVDAAETGPAAVGEDSLDFHDVVDGLAVDH